MIVAIGTLLLVCALGMVGFLVISKVTAHKTPATFETVVAEDDTVVLVNVNVALVKTISINEKINQGDNNHHITLSLVPINQLTYKTKIEQHSWNGSTIVDNLPIINEMYVYLLHGSILKYKICLGNAQRIASTYLYIFDNEESYIKYMEYNALDPPVLKQEIQIGGENITICTNVTFEAKEDAYYYAVLLAPEASTDFSYNVIATENVVDINDYLKDYFTCVIDNSKACVLQTSSSSFPRSEEMVLLAYAKPNYNFQSKINHVQVSFKGRSLIIVIITSVIGAVIVLLVLIFFVVIFGVFMLKRKRSGYIPIN